MSRSGYSDDIENWSLIRWRGQVASAIRGKRGQAFLQELADALDALPEKKLIANDLQSECGVCAIGSVGAKRGVDMSKLDTHDYDTISATFGVAHQLVQEIEWENDEGGWYEETPEARWQRMRKWVAATIPSTPPPPVMGGSK